MTCILYNKVVKGASNRPKSGQNLFSTHILFTYQNIYRTLLSISLTVISRFNNLGAYSRYYVLKQTNKKKTELKSNQIYANASPYTVGTLKMKNIKRVRVEYTLGFFRAVHIALSVVLPLLLIHEHSSQWFFLRQSSLV